MSKRKSYWNYKKIFKKYKGEHDVFVETGTHTADSVCDAIDLGFTKIYSVEINKRFYDQSLKKINQYYPDAIESGKVTLKLGCSREWFPIFLDMIGDQSAMFWLDSHHGSDVPTSNELNKLIASEYKHHTIIIDDMNHHVDEHQMDLYCDTINSDYKTETFTGITPQAQKVYYVK
tara:strand:+ start:549 stop:1073 length:525 start_codon:yes stop_codon:yes gene_type:complete